MVEGGDTQHTSPQTSVVAVVRMLRLDLTVLLPGTLLAGVGIPGLEAEHAGQVSRNLVHPCGVVDAELPVRAAVVRLHLQGQPLQARQCHPSDLTVLCAK